MQKDYKNSLILGLIIGIFLIPTERSLGLAAQFPFIYVEFIGILAFPLLALAGVWFSKLLFSRIPILWQFVKFGLTGVANTAINFGILNVLVSSSNIAAGWPIYLFASIAFVGSLINSYIWNSHWSFENNNSRTTKEFIEFFLVTFVGLQINSIVVYFVATHVTPFSGISPQRWVNVANVIATLTVMFWNFAGFRYLVFKVHSNKMAKA